MIFGASGDLTARKLLPALFHLYCDGYLSEQAPIVGVARRDKTDESFREEMREAVEQHSRSGCWSREKWDAFAKRLYYHRLDITEAEDYAALKRRVGNLEESSGVRGKRVVYLATAPSLFEDAVEHLHAAGFVTTSEEDAEFRVVVEKPFGTDLKSALELTGSLGAVLREDQIYRIDHYLGKETVQNILLFRFGNAIFEPLLTRNHVDHVQITVSETVGMERGRGGYYDKSGALRDVLQNHVLQLLCLIGMEPPTYFRGEDIRDEKLKVLEALRPGGVRTGSQSDIATWAIPGQYTAGTIGDEAKPGYRDEDRIPEGSNRDTYVAMKVFVDNWRWAGVPFYLRTGKRMTERLTEIVIQFKQPPLNLFQTVECEGDLCEAVEAQPNLLVFRIQPREAIYLLASTKRPGMQYQVEPVELDFNYQDLQVNLPEAYERLLLDVMRGDRTLFTRGDELEAAWRFVDPVLKYWEGRDIEPAYYEAGSWGPEEADRLLAESGHKWRNATD